MKFKRITAIFLLAAMLLCAGFSLAEAAKPYILDKANLLMAEDEAKLNEELAEFRELTGMDFVILTTDQPHPGISAVTAADSVFLKGGYGTGKDLDGLIYYIDMDDRYHYLSASGAMIDYMTDERIDAAIKQVGPYLSKGDFEGAVSRMIGIVTEYYRKGIPQGQYQYDVITGQQLTPRHKALTFTELLISLGVSAAAMAITCGSVKGIYHLKGNTYEYDYRENGQLNLTEKSDTFTHTTTSRVPKPKPEVRSGGGMSGGSHSGGSGVHSTGGHSFGGGGGHF